MKHLALLIALLSVLLAGCSDTPAPTLAERRVEPYDTYWDLAGQCGDMDHREAVAMLREANGHKSLVAGRRALVCGTTTTTTSTTTSTSTTTTTSTPVQLGEASVCELESASYEAGTWTAEDGHVIGYSAYEDSEIRDSAGRLVCPPLD